MFHFPSPEHMRAFSDKTGRSLLLRGRKAELVLYVNAELWPVAERVRDDYKLRNREALEDYNEVELLLVFIRHTLHYVDMHCVEFPVRLVLKQLFLTLHVKFLECREPHACLKELLESMELRDASRIYYEAMAVLKQSDDLKDVQTLVVKSALFDEVTAGRAKLLCVFGGQGNTENLLEELLDLDHIYQPLCRPFLKAVCMDLLQAADDPDAKEYLTKGFDILRWIDEPESRPPREYLFSAAVSLPLVGLIQLANYYITSKILGLTPAQLRDVMGATTGHSQGIVSAAVISLSATEAELIANANKALQVLFWIGLRSMQAYPEVTLDPKIQADSLAHSEGMPTPMLAVANLTLDDLQVQVDVSNKFLSGNERIEISLHNGPRAFVCSGPPKSLYGLNLLLRKLKASPELDQTKIPFSERKLKFATKFLPISSPFHCSYLRGAVDQIVADIKRNKLDFNGVFAVPVISTDSGIELSMRDDVMMRLVEQICVQPVHWMMAIVAKPVTHILDFGPGHASGIGALTHKNVDGSGIQVVLAGTLDTPVPHLQSRRHLFGSSPSSVKYGVNWALRYRPNLVRNEADGKFYVETNFSRLLSKQPLMVAGMTPTTIDAEFVSACINAGYHVELSGGGHFMESMLRDKINLIVSKIKPGHGISLNSLFINQRLWAFQFPLVQTMRKEGTPIEGFTVAAGVPSLENANDIISALMAAGIRHVSFKPGSVDGILQVVTIAKHNPNCPIILQWTGGRAGGHHSYEDFHQPILDTYAAIRSCDNICLVAGSGFGDGEVTYAYLDGSWSKAFNYPAMPFDGLLLGSRLLVAKESQTSPSVKQTIASVAGITDEKDWVKSYKGAIGGIVTVISEMGEPIHKVATRGVLFWKELDETVFKLPRDKRLPWLLANKARIIARLNADAHKVWFGKNKAGQSVDLAEMTYKEVLLRLAELLYVRHQKRWIDPTLRRLFFDVLKRAEERLIGTAGPSCIPSAADLALSPNIDPLEFLGHLEDAPFDLDQLMSSDDCLHFITLCKRFDMKPVPFVPVFDDNFEIWYKRDSLWQSEDIDAVVDQDAQRVCILQGPVAVRYCKKVDEPVGEILDGIVATHVKYILRDFYGGDVKKVPSVMWFGGSIVVPEATGLGCGIAAVEASGPKKVLVLTKEAPVPSNTELFGSLCDGRQSWLSALLLSEYIMQGKTIVPNTVRDLFKPRAGFSYSIDNQTNPTEFVVATSCGKRMAEAIMKADEIEVKVHYHGSQGVSVLNLAFKFVPACSNILIHEVMKDRNERIKAFYWNLWFRDEPLSEFEACLKLDPLTATFKASEKIQSKLLQKFCRIVGNHAAAYSHPTPVAPMDFAIVVVWRAVIKSLFPAQIDGDLLKLVHLSNRIAYVESALPLRADQQVTSEAHISSIKWTPTGKIVEVEAIATADNLPVLKVVSRFMYRGSFAKDGFYFDKGRGLTKKLMLQTPEELAVFHSKSWINWATDKAMNSVHVGATLLIKLDYLHLQDVSSGVPSAIQCSGEVLLKTDTKEYSRIGVVEFKSNEALKANPVLHYLERHSHLLEAPTLFSNEIPIADDSAVVLTTSSSNQTYSDVSGDHNPIHTDILIADLAALPGTITHGMWTSAAVRAQVETFAAENQPLRVRDYEITFDGMVLPSDTLTTRLFHVGMKSGRKLIKLETTNQNGAMVIHGVAEVEQPRTAFVFTGQGSQEVGMGMDLYSSSKVAKEIWDQADEHFIEKYGFSILDIVRTNPKELTIYFGGPRGQLIKKNYQSMTYEKMENGSTSSVTLFPQITESSTSFSFSAPNGLLYATQFTQPALTLMEKAAYEDMKVKGLAGPGSAFAGHSLGEYAALASVGDVLSIATLCDIVFYRGLTMQVAVERDTRGRSQYGMVAVNPSRVGPGFDDQALRALVPQISQVSGRLLEIVNYNVENWQYVVAGDLVALDCLSNVLNYIAMQKIDVAKLIAQLGMDRIKEELAKIISEVLIKSLNKLKSSEHISLERGVATIALVGIDVPFHSSFLLGGVSSFRKCLESRIKPATVDPNVLRGHYVPNLTGAPFDTTLDYIKLVLELSDSSVLGDLVSKWKEPTTAAEVQLLARIILIELLAYQFASPVRWIETQDVLFRDFAIERLIEVGPTPVLSGMAERTLKIKYQEYDDVLNQIRTLWSYNKNRPEIYYEYTPKDLEGAVKEEAKKAESQPKVQQAAVVSSPGSPVKRLEDLPFDSEELLRILIALKTKRTLEDVPPAKSIKDLSGGKSTLQNEILADLQKEFGDVVPERPEELPIRDLGAHLRPHYKGAPGRYTSGLIGRLFSAKMAAGWNQASARDLLEKEFGLSVRAADQLLMYSLHMEPASRLASEDVAKVWLREVAAKFFGTHSLELPSAGGSGGNTEVAAVSSAELERLQSKQKRLIRQQIELFATYVEQNLLEFQAIAEDKSQQIALLQQDLDLWLAEFGPTFQDGVRPIFSNIKTRRYDSFWNWARQDVYMLYYDILFGRLVNVDRDVTAKCLHVMNRSSQDLVDFMEYHIVVKGPDLMHKGVTDEAYILTRRYGEMLITQVKEALNRAPVYKDVSLHTRPQVQISYDGSIEYSEVRRSGVSSFEAYVRELSRGSEKLGKTTFGGEPRPLLFIRERSTEDHTRWEYAQSKTNLYFEVMSDMAINGVSYEGKTALITGAGKGSIGSEIVKGLLSGGAKVVVTTSSFTRTTVDYFRAIYECHGARSSCLIIAPFNQGSMQDVESLIEFIYNKDSAKGLGWDLDYIVPFAAITENGREVTDLDGKSELAHRIMMTNVLRLAGLVARKKRERRIETRPAQVVLPLSPNHGIFGKDGLYSESKLGLETLFNRWHSEDWKDYLSVVGAVIGWTRGTGLMNENNLIAEAMERAGLRTFSSSEMAFNILALMHPRMVRLSEEGPLYGDLNGGLDVIKNLAEFTRDIRTNITDGAQIRRALAKERAMEASLEVNPVERVPTVQPRANMSFKYPELPNASQLPGNPLLAGLLDLSKVVVVTGFGEVGPWGNSRTRWEMEAAGELSLEACIEMAWLMGLVRYHTGVDAKGAPYTGWVDAATGSPVQDYDVKAKYEETILKHSGIRFVEPELFNGYDPQRKSFCQEIVIEYDMAPIEVTREEADHFKLMHGEKADVYQTGNGDSWNVKLRKGATIYVPKALRFDRLVAGQIPTGWNAERYGVPKDICQQVDPVTLFVLVSTVDALVSAGITDPYEFYQYVHLAEVGNTSGGGEGGMWMNKMIFQYRYLDKPVQADVLQETFINTMPAWVNLLLLSSSGPIKTPVGACATAVESVEIGVETILSGKAKIVIAGGYDDFQEESSYEFGSMQATSSGVEELAKGRQPDEMSRPTATSRAGFMESHGAGIQVLMTAELALQMGCPIYGIIALTNTATDKEGRSIPAPGQGILTTARSVRPDGYKPRLLDMEYRHSQLQKGLENIKLWLGDELLLVKEEADAIADPAERSVYLAGLVADIEKEAERREAAERQLWAFDFWKGDARIAPLEGALATYGLTVDDIGVGSFHGTGTKANDVNESDVVNKQLHHLGRTRGNLLPCICQKYLTGHPKGAAAAWMLNGGIIPGNRNADNIDAKLHDFSYLLFLSRTIQTTGVRAALLKSFGFGQVGGEVLVVHPHYLFRALPEGIYTSYIERRAKRQAKTFRYLHDALIGVAPLVQVKTEPPYSAELESLVYLNPAARAEYDDSKGSWTFKSESVDRAKSNVLNDTTPGSVNALLQDVTARSGVVKGVGVDVQLIGEVNILSETFLDRNFTIAEQEYCRSQPDPRASFAGRWAGKEAVVKALCNATDGVKPDWLEGAGGALKAVEILNEISGAPKVVLHGEEAGKIVKVSISHSGSYAAAVAIAE